MIPIFKNILRTKTNVQNSLEIGMKIYFDKWDFYSLKSKNDILGLFKNNIEI